MTYRGSDPAYHARRRRRYRKASQTRPSPALIARQDLIVSRDQEGDLKVYDPKKDHGFITPTSGRSDVFFSGSEMRRAGIVDVVHGEMLLVYDVERSRGHPQRLFATNLRRKT